MADEQGNSLNSLVIEKYSKECCSKGQPVQTYSGVLDFIRNKNGENAQHWVVNFSDKKSSFVLEKDMYDVLQGRNFEKGIHQAEPYARYVFLEDEIG